ncbi:MAG: hypothetical protein M1838_001954 [Thelocarpon superellum]|nr:MAG: hypothetical protein M1838_001954 [Thelocarpon superellum]
MALGILLGNFVPNTGPALQKGQFVGVSAPIAIGLLVMMYPILCKVRFEALHLVFQSRALWVQVGFSIVVNWVIAPLVMVGLAWAFLPDQPQLREGLILVGVARCIAMVLVWTGLAGGDSQYCAILVAINSILQMLLFAPLAIFYLKVVSNSPNAVAISYPTVAQSVAVFLGIPLGAAIVTRFGLRRVTRASWYDTRFLPWISPLSLLGLLFTILILFASQGKHVVQQIVSVVRVAAPLVVYFMIIFFLTLFATHRLGFGYRLACTQSFTAASNNFELAIAVAIATFGVNSEQALAATALAQRLLLSTLTGRPIHVSQIRASSPTNPGLAPHEVSLLRLLEAVSNGSSIEISYTGTILRYRPGLITGSAPGTGARGGVIHHVLSAECTRGVTYFLLPLCLLAPFSKAPVNVLFTGPGVITSATPTGDVSIDTLRTAILPLYEHFGISNNVELRTLRRSAPGPQGAGGAGEVQLVFGHQVRLPKTIHLLNPGRVKRIRGVAYATGVSGSNNARVIEAARAVLNPLVGDVYIFSDVSSAPWVASEDTSSTARKKTGVGFGISLVAESSTGARYSADVATTPEGGQRPEDLGRQSAHQLLENIARGGCVSLAGASTMLILMAMGSEDVGRLCIGRDVLGTEEIIGLARDLSTFGASGWGIRDADDSVDDELILSLVGRGVGNVGRKMA